MRCCVMDSIADMGGTQGWGHLHPPRADEPVFGEPWQGRAFELTLLSVVVSGQNIDAFRHAQERLDRAAYLDDGYFGRWLSASELMLTDSAILAPGAIDARARNLRGKDAEEPPIPEPARPDYVPSRDVVGPGRFGDRRFLSVFAAQVAGASINGTRRQDGAVGEHQLRGAEPATEVAVVEVGGSVQPLLRVPESVNVLPGHHDREQRQRERPALPGLPENRFIGSGRMKLAPSLGAPHIGNTVHDATSHIEQ